MFTTRYSSLILIALAALVGLAYTGLGDRLLSAAPAQAGMRLTISDIAKSAPSPVLPLTPDSSISDTLALMLRSHQTWNTMQVNYFARFRDANTRAVILESNHDFRLTSSGMARAEIGPTPGKPDLVWIKNGEVIWTEDRESGRTSQSPVPAAFLSIDDFGTLVPDNEPVVVPHPVGLLMPSWLSDYVYPTALAQSMSLEEIAENVVQRAKILGSEQVAGRPTVVVQRQIQSLDNPPIVYKFHRYWVDAERGVVLKAEVLDPRTGDWVQQVEALGVNYDEPISPETFQVFP